MSSTHQTSRGVALPDVNSPDVLGSVLNLQSRNAYIKCLNEERIVPAEKQRFLRILGYLLLHAPNSEVQEVVTRYIELCEDDLPYLGQYFEHYVIPLFNKSKSQIPKPLNPPSGLSLSLEATRQEVEVEIEQASPHREQAKKKALLRDQNRCVVMHTIHVPCDPSDSDTLSVDTHAQTHCCHIIPESMFFNVNPAVENNHNKRHHSSTVLAILRNFGYDISRFNGPKVHSLRNVMTLCQEVHDRFDRMYYYFEATSEQDKYIVGAYKMSPHLYKTATFTTHNAETHPVPSPELLALHATCCKVAWLSGAADYIDIVYRDEEDISVLASDITFNAGGRYKPKSPTIPVEA